MNRVSSPHAETAQMRLPQLDGLRVVAVLAVLVQHSFGFFGFNGDHWTNLTLPLPGPAGVRLFFVLSGFLITDILLRARNESARLEVTRWSVVKAFYARRMLRIFPLYYLALAVAAVAPFPGFRSHWIWYVTYFPNALCVRLDGWDRATGHLWSLSVEEQFYLLWPLLILFLPKRAVVPGVIGTILVAAIARMILLASNLPLAAYVLTFARADALAVGGLLACARHRDLGLKGSAIAQTVMKSALSVGVALLLLTWLGRAVLPVWLRAATSESGFVFLAGWIVYRSAIGFTGLLGRLLDNRVTEHLATISYGIYVWHFFVPSLVIAIQQLTHTWLRYPWGNETSQFLYVLVASVLLAQLSWTILEQPLNRLKRCFPYVKARHSRQHDIAKPAAFRLA